MTCHYCRAIAGKFGFHKGHQRYRCRLCGKTFSDIPDDGNGDLRTPPDKVFMVVGMLCEGVGIRAIQRLTGLAKHTVLNILEMAGEKAQRLLDAKLQKLS